MRVRFLGAHNAESKESRMVSLLIDNELAIDAGNLVSELTFLEQEKIKAILISHGHYDHIKDIPAFAFNNYTNTTKIYATNRTQNIVKTHLTDGIIYPKFTEKIPFFLEKPSIEFETIEPFNSTEIESYQVLALPVNHTIRTMGFEVTSKDGGKIFYTSDTGPGLSALWEHVSPHVLIIDTTFPNNLEIRAKNSAHLCPKMLKKEITEFYRVKEYYPRIILVHLCPKFENEIKKEVKEISDTINVPIEIAFEGMEITVDGDIYEKEKIDQSV